MCDTQFVTKKYWTKNGPLSGWALSAQGLGAAQEQGAAGASLPDPCSWSAQGVGAAATPLDRHCYDRPFCSIPDAGRILWVQPQSELKPGEIKPMTKKDLDLQACRCEDCG